MSDLGQMMGRAMATQMLLIMVVVAAVAIGLWEVIPWLWHHLHWSWQ